MVGLGLKTIQEVNEVLLTKLALRYICQPHLLWAKLFKCKYGDPASWHEDHRQKPSFVSWRSLLLGYKLLRKGLRFTEDDRGSFKPWWKPSTNGKITTKPTYKLQSDGGQEID